MEPFERRILTVTCFGHFMSHFNMLVFPALVLPLSDKTGLSLAQVLNLSFGQYLLFGLSALPWGLAADRLGPRPLMKLYFLGAGLCGLASAYFIDSPAALPWALAGIGLFSGIYHPAGLGLISKSIKRVSAAMGYNGMFGNMGLAAAPLLTGLINYLSGPTAAYVFVGLLNLVGLGAIFVLGLESPVDDETNPAKPTDGPHRAAPFIILLAAMMLGGLVYRGATVILPTYFEIRASGIYDMLETAWPGGLSANLVATALTSFIYFVGILGQFSGGMAGERFEVRRSYLVFHLLTLPPVFLMAAIYNWGLVALSVVYFFFLLGMQPLENTLVARLTPPRFRHSAFGAKFVLTFGVGALAVKIVGGLEAAWGLGVVFPALGVVSAALVLTIIFLITQTKPVRAE